MQKLSDLYNIGPELERQLNEIGIYTYEELKETGSKNAWQKIRKIDDSACIHRLYALEGAIQNVKKSQLKKETKEELKEFYQWIKTI